MSTGQASSNSGGANTKAGSTPHVCGSPVNPPAVNYGNATNGGMNLDGWPVMAKTVRDHDEEKVKDCKEDIDTLLVFAGLYSAVLSAFVIESYQALQPDSKDEIVFLLRHMAAQNYSFNLGFLNATNPLPDPPTFQPPTWAVRVNALWFVSLVFSLAAASIGMLVKQWLREFLAMPNSSPQRKLRRRQYREPSLDQWLVYEIAACLPLLLQVSLGLFFVGLCFFTAEIHQGIGKVTLSFVCAWAFFVVTTTIAPLFSPRCPFKTTFLKDIMVATRRGFLCPLIAYCLHRNKARVDKLQAHMKEEDDFLDDGGKDAELLLAVDAVIPGNGFLSTILTAYKPEAGRDKISDARFMMTLVSHRTTANGILNATDLRALAKQDWEALADAISNTVAPLTVTPSQPDLESWTVNVAILHLTRSSPDINPTIDDYLHQHLPGKRFPGVFEVINTFYKDDLASLAKCHSHVLRVLRRNESFRRVVGTTDPLDMDQWIDNVGTQVMQSLCPLNICSTYSIDSSSSRQQQGATFNDAVRTAIDFIAQVIKWRVEAVTPSPNYSRKAKPWLIDAFFTLLATTRPTPDALPSPAILGFQDVLASYFYVQPSILTDVATRMNHDEMFIPMARFLIRLCSDPEALEACLKFYRVVLVQALRGDSSGQTRTPPQLYAETTISSNHDHLLYILQVMTRTDDGLLVGSDSVIIRDLKEFLLDIIERIPLPRLGEWSSASRHAVLSIVILSRACGVFRRDALRKFSEVWASSGTQRMDALLADPYDEATDPQSMAIDDFFKGLEIT